MKKVLLIALVVISFNQLNAQSITPYTDTAIYRLDTIINMTKIDGSFYTLYLLRDKLNENFEAYENEAYAGYSAAPLTLLVQSMRNGKLVYAKKIIAAPGDQPYINCRFYKANNAATADTGKLFVELNKSYGGSGSLSTWYHVTMQNGKMTLNTLFDGSGELTLVAHAKNDASFIVLDGIWNMHEGEAHFGEHRYALTQYSFVDGFFQSKKIGTTKYKYEVADGKNAEALLLKSIQQKEPNLFKKFPVKGY
ncbi:MAG: hypothetical protein ACOYKE_03835 [Ferruginibacter sp.]